MKNVYIYCEGQTEEAFINEILCPYLLNFNVYVTPIICTTKRTLTEKYRGGVRDYNKIKNELSILCRQHRHEVVTTMFDYYGMPSNTPGIDSNETDIYRRLEHIESVLTDNIAQPNCFFGLTLHEFEGLLFSDPSAFHLISSEDVVRALDEIRNEVDTPEHINNSYETAPSKRLEKLIPNYAKVRYGLIVSKGIGIDKLLAECKHFSNWIEKIKNITQI